MTMGFPFGKLRGLSPRRSNLTARKYSFCDCNQKTMGNCLTGSVSNNIPAILRKVAAFPFGMPRGLSPRRSDLDAREYLFCDCNQKTMGNCLTGSESKNIPIVLRKVAAFPFGKPRGLSPRKSDLKVPKITLLAKPNVPGRHPDTPCVQEPFCPSRFSVNSSYENEQFRVALEEIFDTPLEYKIEEAFAEELALEPTQKIRKSNLETDEMLAKEISSESKIKMKQPNLTVDDILAKECPLESKLKMKLPTLTVDDVLAKECPLESKLKMKVLLSEGHGMSEPVEFKQKQYEECGQRPKSRRGRGKERAKPGRTARCVTDLQFEYTRKMEDAKRLESIETTCSEILDKKKIQRVRFSDHVAILSYNPKDSVKAVVSTSLKLMEKVSSSSTARKDVAAACDESNMKSEEEMNDVAEEESVVMHSMADTESRKNLKPVAVAKAVETPVLYDMDDLKLMAEIERDYGV